MHHWLNVPQNFNAFAHYRLSLFLFQIGISLLLILIVFVSVVENFLDILKDFVLPEASESSFVLDLSEVNRQYARVFHVVFEHYCYRIFVLMVLKLPFHLNHLIFTKIHIFSCYLTIEKFVLTSGFWL